MIRLPMWEKDRQEWQKIYDITYDKNGYPLFLIYEDGAWKRKSAKHYAPQAPWQEDA